MTVQIPQTTAQLALDAVYDVLVTESADRLDPAPAVHFGWREAPKQVNQGAGGANRIVLQPGDPSGKVGDLSGGKMPGRNPPPVATLAEIGTLYLWAVDLSDSTDARKQWIATRRLFDVVIASLQRNFTGRWKILSNKWIRTDLERPFGAEIELVFAVEAYVPGDPIPVAPGGTVTTIAHLINGASC